MGEVYRADDERLRRDVAIKVLPSHLAGDPSALERFRREARAVASLSHPNILAIFDVGEEGGIHYAVTELLEGETLRHRLMRGAMSAREALHILLPIAEGIAAAHGRGLIHRDLKPENIFLTTTGRVKVLDFGLARGSSGLPGNSHDTETLHTEPGTVMGTIGYMAPEQLEARPLTPATDVFALGCMLFEMVTNRLPFEGPSSAHSMAALLRDPAPRLPETADPLTEDIDLLVQQCLAKDPRDRLKNGGEVAEVIRSITTGETMGRRRPSSLLRRTRRFTFPIVVVLLVILAGAAAALYLRNERLRQIDNGFDVRAGDVRGDAETKRLLEFALRADAQGNRAKAFELLQEAHRRGAKTALPAAFLASYSEANGDLDAARRWVAEAQRRLTSDASSYESLLVRYLVARSSDAAQELALANSLLDLRPDAWRLRLAAAHIHLGRRDGPAALRELKRIDVKSVDDRRLMLVLADRASLGDIDGAERDLARSGLATRPPLLFYTRARIAWSRGQFARSREMFDRAAAAAAEENLGALEAESRIMAGLSLIRVQDWTGSLRALAVSGARARQLGLAFRELESAALAGYAANRIGDFEERDRKLAVAHALASHPGHIAAVRLLALRLRSPVVASWPAPPDFSAHAYTAGVGPLIEGRQAWLRQDFVGARRLLNRARAEGVDTTGMREEAELLAAELGLPFERLPADPPYPNILRYLAIFDMP